MDPQGPGTSSIQLEYFVDLTPDVRPTHGRLAPTAVLLFDHTYERPSVSTMSKCGYSQSLIRVYKTLPNLTLPPCSGLHKTSTPA